MSTGWLALALSLTAAAAAAQENPDGPQADADAGEPGPPGCKQAISPENAQRLYAALLTLHGADGCSLEEVRTQKDVMRVEWKKAGVSAPLIEIRPSVCGPGSTVTGPVFAMSAPADTVEKCPAAVEKMKSLIAGDTLGGAVKLGANSDSVSPGTLWASLGGVALLALAALFIWWRRRGKPAA